MANQENRTLTDQFMLRMPDGMRDRIKRAAEANGRSMNSEILSVLHERYPEPRPLEDWELILKALAYSMLTEPDEAKRRELKKRFDDEVGKRIDEGCAIIASRVMPSSDADPEGDA